MIIDNGHVSGKKKYGQVKKEKQSTKEAALMKQEPIGGWR